MLAMCVATVGASAPETPAFLDVVIDEPFRPYLLTNPLLMEVAGAKVIHLPGGRRVLLAVACTDWRDNSGKDQMRRTTLCRNKARAALLTEQQGVQVATLTKSEERDVITIENGVEHGRSIAESLEITTSQAQGLVQEMPVVGTWRSPDGSLFYLALGRFVDP
jgi:hypothetical protein